MPTRMLIDARHREETRVAVVKGSRIEEFDFESAEHKQLKGNIYLAKVTRVEPSLQAAFVDYGGNRHGFLAFSEIHPDYYQIPREDREALLREEAEHAAEEERRREAEGDLEPLDGHHDDDGRDERPDAAPEADAAGEDAEPAPAPELLSGDEPHGDDQKAASQARANRMSLRRRYKIQDVIRRRQVLLVQVVKEERGNKGAALTTYLSLAGRYCVLMPNTSHGGGISRKISNGADRKRLKSIIADLTLPPSMGCIVRTAGLQRTKTEIKRDFDYLARLWDEIREKTLNASAPAPIHTDSDLIKRAIRDIYNRDIEEVLVEGEDGYRAAKDFMKLLMPSHAKKVKHYADPVSLFQRHGVEDQLAAMYNPTVQLKSGGYLVINPTEALVSIDINSGRSTREHGIEQTAVATNLEAAREIARQLRLRDMAGLVVIDFIDMESNSNIRKVEKAMKDALKDDRARIQVGRISGFGLMEMSRQRLRTGVLEASTRMCPHCEGTGLVRTASSSALSALRLIEEEAARGRATRLVLRASQEASVYVLNAKRAEIAEIEDRYGVRVEVLPDGETEGARMTLEASGPPPVNIPRFERVIEEDDSDIVDEDAFEDDEDSASEGRDELRHEREDGREDAREDGGRRRRRRRRRGGRDDREGEAGERRDRSERPEGQGRSDGDDMDEQTAAPAQAPEGERDAIASDDASEEEGRRRRRGRRGGRRRREREDAAGHSAGEGVTADGGADRGNRSETAAADTTPLAAESSATEASVADSVASDEAVADVPKTRRRPRAQKAVDAQADGTADAPAKPKRASRAKKAAPVETDAVVIDSADTGSAEAMTGDAAEVADKPRRASRARKPAAPKASTAKATGAKADEAKTPAARSKNTKAAKAKTDDAAGTDEAPARATRKAAPKAAAERPVPVSDDTPASGSAAPSGDSAAAGASTEEGPRRKGWWQRTFG